MAGDADWSSGGSQYWDAVAERWLESQPQRLWRQHSDSVNARLLERWLPVNLASVLKTDLFDESMSAGLYRTLAARAERGVRSNAISMTQIGRELEESAQVCGASWWSTFRRILLPLMLPGLVAGWIYIMLVSFRELSTSIVLYSPGNEVLSIVIWERYESGAFPELAALGLLMVLVTGALAAVAYRLSAQRADGP